MKKRTDYQIHLRYCKDKGYKPVTYSTFKSRKAIGWTRKAQIFTPHQGHGGSKRYNTITIKDERLDFMKENKLKVPYSTFLYHYRAETISKFLQANKSKWKYRLEQKTIATQ